MPSSLAAVGVVVVAFEQTIYSIYYIIVERGDRPLVLSSR